jgi:hypothetical protein
MVILYILLAWSLAIVVLAGAWQYLSVLDRRNEEGALAHFKGLPHAEKLSALNEAQEYMCTACFQYACLHQLWRNYKWGYRHNPYFIPRFVAQMECARARKLVDHFKDALTASY